VLRVNLCRCRERPLAENRAVHVHGLGLACQPAAGQTCEQGQRLISVIL